MSAALILGCLWVLAAAVTAMLPMRRQYVPGVTLLIADGDHIEVGQQLKKIDAKRKKEAALGAGGYRGLPAA